VEILRAFASSAMSGTRSKMSAAGERTAADGGKDDTDGVSLFFHENAKIFAFRCIDRKERVFTYIQA
jgi:hypothetical protein